MRDTDELVEAGWWYLGQAMVMEGVLRPQLLDEPRKDALKAILRAALTQTEIRLDEATGVLR